MQKLLLTKPKIANRCGWATQRVQGLDRDQAHNRHVVHEVVVSAAGGPGDDFQAQQWWNALAPLLIKRILEAAP